MLPATQYLSRLAVIRDPRLYPAWWLSGTLGFTPLGEASIHAAWRLSGIPGFIPLGEASICAAWQLSGTLGFTPLGGYPGP